MLKPKIVVLKWIDPLTLAKLFGLLNGIFGFIMSIVIFVTGQNQFLPQGIPIGILSIILLPMLNAFGGFVFGWFAAMVYNTLVKRIRIIHIRGIA